MIYFGMASLWGFITGTVAMMMGTTALHASPGGDSGMTMRLGAAVLIAVVGGVVVSLAYREAVRRSGD